MLEILAPAGNIECAMAAINNGANAVYVGLSSFSARQGAENFDELAFSALVQRAHLCGVKVYVAMNTIVKDAEIEPFFRTLLSAWNLGGDAIILQDIFLGKIIHERYPQIILHLSTQAGVCNLLGAKLAKEYGFSRVILARETSFDEIKKIAQIIETEVFIQGALCTAFSGQCYFSSFIGGNSGNRGRCKQPCRKTYAYDRNNNEEKTYALSLSDLCVGEDIEKLIAAGVTSFKIEGRMRRAEYVGAAVRYYRVLLQGENTAQALSDLKRTYNRGNYTKGLAFGQDKRFLSTAIQGHIGEKVGVVKVVNGKFLVESHFKPRTGDAFKILREGKEIGGAFYVKAEGKSFVISSKTRLKNGDGVFITTDTAVNEKVLSTQKVAELKIKLFFKEGGHAKASCGDFIFEGDAILQSAQNHSLRIDELKSCFSKTDGLPVEISFESIELIGDIFIPKSALNAFRRDFYSTLCASIALGERTHYNYKKIDRVKQAGDNSKTAVISNDFQGITPDIAIYKANDLSLPLPKSFTNGNFEKYLYYPAFTNGQDLFTLTERLREGEIDGIYAENYSGVYFAKEQGLKLFAGTGFHLINGLSIEQVLKEGAAYYALSKEANGEEIATLSGEKAFVLSSGDIKLMDLCYCPFRKTCKNCDKRDIYLLTDENNRVFPVKRYLAGDGACRFEVYNCASLIGVGVNGVGQLLDLTISAEKTACFLAKDNEMRQKEVYATHTSGHYKRGVL